MEACRKEKEIVRLDNFRAGWDFARFVSLVEQLGKETMTPVWPKYEDIQRHLKKCLSGRNLGAHECHSKQTEGYYTDGELDLLVRSAKLYLPQINPSKRGALTIKKKLKELEELLDSEDESEVALIRREKRC